MKKIFISMLFAIMIFFLSIGVLSAAVLTFEDTGYTGTSWADMPTGYGGFTWSNYFDVYYGPGDTLGFGYDAGTVSGDYAAFNSFGESVSLADGKFDWTGAWFNDPHDSTSLDIYGKNNGSVVYSATVQLACASPVWFQADWFNIDELYFQTDSTNDWFTMDDFTYNESAPVPEPDTMLLLGSGLVGLAGFRRKLKRK